MTKAVVTQGVIQKNLSKGLLEDWSPRKINQQIKSRTIEGVISVINSEGLQSFGRMNPEFVKSVLMVWLIGLNEFIYGNDMQKSLTENQIESTAETLIEMPEFRNITIADLSLVFKKAYSGEFGELYGRIRPDVIMKWFVKYFDNRCSVAAGINQTKDMQQKQFLAHVPRQSAESESMRDGMKQALSHQQKQKEYSESQVRIDKAKQQMK